jgi:protein involved in polysaccharide export with SLBB domain
MNNRSRAICPRFDLSVFNRIGSSAAAALLATIMVLSGCNSNPPSAGMPVTVPTDVQTLSSGDVIKIEYPGTSSMPSTEQTIRRDGRINLTIIGEVKAADKTPSELENELKQAYASQLTSKEVKVTVVASAFSVYVGGAVMKPGKIMPLRAVTVLDAIMEAGGFDETRANKKNVRVLRQEGNQVKTYYVNMQDVLNGVQKDPMYLKAHDTVYVPEKISWF